MVAVDLKSVERSSRIRPTSTNCSDAVHGEQRKEKESKARRKREVRQLASSGEGRGRLGDATDGRETGIGLHDDTHGGGRLRESSGAITATCSTGRWEVGV